MEKFVRIFKIIFLLLYSVSLGQTISVFVDEKPIFDQQIDSIEQVLSDDLIRRGYFGGKMILSENNRDRLSYQFVNDSKVIDELSFSPSIPINADILEKMFSPLYRINQVNSIGSFERRLHSGYSFIPDDSMITFGRVDDTKLGAFIDFVPEFNSHFSGIIGAINNDNGNWSYSGEVEMRLENSWRTASATDMIWKRYNEESQYIRFAHEEPYPLGLPFGVKIEYDQDFRDGDYVLNKTTGAFSVINKSGKWYFGGSKEVLAPTVKGDSAGIESFHSESFSMTFISDSRNDRWLPTGGYFLEVNTEIGEMNKIGSTFKFNMIIEELLSLTNHFSVQLKLNNSGVWNSDKIESVHEGQLIRYGGYNSIRGYEEDILKSDLVSVLNGNILFIPNNSIQLYPFVDLAYNYGSVEYSRGFGIRQRTNTSVLEISFGWPGDVAFSAGKVHVKFTSLLD